MQKKINPDKKNQETLKEYKEFVQKKLAEFIPPLQKISMGDYSVELKPPQKEDEFSELTAALHITINELIDIEERRKAAENEKIEISIRTLESYKKYVSKKLEDLTPTFQRIAMGDFSVRVDLPKKEDEFTPLIASMSMLLDDLRFLNEENKKNTEELEYSKKSLEVRVKAKTRELTEFAETLEQKVKERTDELQEKLKELERTRQALTNILEDIAGEKRKAEEEKNKTLDIITNLVDGLLLFSKGGNLSLINRQAEIFFGVKAREVIGKSVLELSELATLSPLINLLKGGGERIFRKELFLKDDLILEVSTISITETGGELDFLVITHDITREKFVEKMKTEFVSISAHQLRTPLSAIKWTLRMLLDGDVGELTEEQKEFLEKTYISNERMIALINDLLNVTRIEEGKQLHSPVLADIEPLVKTIMDSCEEEVERKKIKMSFLKPKENLPKLMLDVEKTKLAFQNIIDNAVKYTPSGGQIKISLRIVDKNVEFSVEDTGVGVPSNQQARIFTKFFRGANVVRIDTDGSGLGLFIAKNIIEAHGGKIWFESEENKGTTFYLSFPF